MSNKELSQKMKSALLSTKSDEVKSELSFDEVMQEMAGQIDDLKAAKTAAEAELEASKSKQAEVVDAIEALKAKLADTNPEETEEVKSARSMFKKSMTETGGEIIKAGKLQGAKNFGAAGDIIVTEFNKTITQRILETSKLVSHFGQETGILDYKKKVAKGGTVASWEGEYTSTVPVLVDVASTGGKLTSSPMVEKTVAADAFFDAYGFLETDAMKRISAQAAVAMLQGDGVKKPKGIVKHFDKVEGLKPVDTRDVETFSSVVATVADATLIDLLRDLVNSVPAEYHGNARWGMSREAFNTVYALKDADGRSYLQPDPQNPMSFLLHGFEIVLDVTLAASAPIMFGDFDAGFKVLNVPQAIDLVANPFRVPGFMVYDITYRAAVIMGANDAIAGLFLPEAGV
ncbi:phage major capsid protein [Aeromonas rivipollensis]|uniref:phage major capsid protein n=1 Tax=Aeromonas rivipollensis TaxID=948519 RepID=UPI0013D73B3F|nr:phage major capsid protein [Aeromonas rivipollensis]NEX81759.1 phage major capsid protein [Aeromonas rivipollensis]